MTIVTVVTIPQEAASSLKASSTASQSSQEKEDMYGKDKNKTDFAESIRHEMEMVQLKMEQLGIKNQVPISERWRLMEW